MLKKRHDVHMGLYPDQTRGPIMLQSIMVLIQTLDLNQPHNASEHYGADSNFRFESEFVFFNYSKSKGWLVPRDTRKSFLNSK